MQCDFNKRAMAVLESDVQGSQLHLNCEEQLRAYKMQLVSSADHNAVFRMQELQHAHACGLQASVSAAAEEAKLAAELAAQLSVTVLLLQLGRQQLQQGTKRRPHQHHPSRASSTGLVRALEKAHRSGALGLVARAATKPARPAVQLALLWAGAAIIAPPSCCCLAKTPRPCNSSRPALGFYSSTGSWTRCARLLNGMATAGHPPRHWMATFNTAQEEAAERDPKNNNKD